ncbi:MAG: hypothetical protein J7K83_00910 [Candidatus Aenigmarchaeota archaeon]|nr:hypothetical protein [Candidatus Aenigmarchaeota archaeon]
MKKYILPMVFAILAFLAANNISQAKVLISTEENLFTAHTGEKLEIPIIIENNDTITRTITLTVYPPNFYGVSLYFDKTSLTLQPGEQEVVKLYVNVPFTVDSSILSSGSRYLPFKFTISAKYDSTSDEKGVRIVFQRKWKVVVPEMYVSKTSVLPGDEIIIKAVLENVEPDPSGKYVIHVSLTKGNTILIDEKKEIENIPGNGMYVYTKTFAFDQYAEPGDYTLSIIVKDEYGNEINKSSYIITLPQIERVVVTKSAKYNFLQANIKITLKNIGNKWVNYTYIERFPRFVLGFVRFDQQPEIKKGAFAEAIWYIPLSPGEEKEITFKIVLWPYVTVVSITGVLLIFGLAMYYTPAVAKKYSRRRKDEIRIKLKIKNTSRKPIRDVVVRDFVPEIYTVVKKFETIKPTIRKVKGGYELLWRIEKMMPGEERLIAYSIIPSIEIIGKPKLPPAKMRYTDRTKKRKSARGEIIFRFFD